MLTLRHATAATVRIKRSGFGKKEVLLTLNKDFLKLWCPKTHFCELIEPRIDKANTVGTGLDCSLTSRGRKLLL